MSGTLSGLYGKTDADGTEDCGRVSVHDEDGALTRCSVLTIKMQHGNK